MNSSGRPVDHEWISDWKSELQNKNVLELGCGAGADTAEIGKLAHSVIACDIERQTEVASRFPFVQFDHSKSFPLSGQFDAVVASLCLHYFTWEVTESVFEEIARLLGPKGVLICRVNSAEDHNYGATGYVEIERGLFDVLGEPKRFFSSEDIARLLREKWLLANLQHKAIDRYDKLKWVWEFSARRSEIATD